MSVYDRTAELVQQWATMPALPLSDDHLEDLWSTYGTALVFYPSAAQDLVARCLKKFAERQGLSNDLKTGYIYDSVANTGGTIKDVDGLAKVILASPISIRRGR